MEASKSAGHATEAPSAKTKTADTPTQHKPKRANRKLKTKNHIKSQKPFNNKNHNHPLVAAKGNICVEDYYS